MFRHDKHLLESVNVERPNPQYAVMIQEQLGGPNGELKAGLQYLSQSFRIKDPEIRDLFLDIASEEFSHMEMVATAVNMLNGHDINMQGTQPSGNIEANVLTGLSPYLTNGSGTPFTATYVNVTGDLPADILSNIAAEQRAKVVYEYLYRQIDDRHIRQMIDFLLNREEAHNTLFREAFQKIQDSGSNLDWGVDSNARLYFDLSSPPGRFSELNNPQAPNFQYAQQYTPQ